MPFGYRKEGMKSQSRIVVSEGHGSVITADRPSTGWANRLVQCSTVLGLTQKESTKRIGVDARTLDPWKRGEQEPADAFAAVAKRFLAAAEGVKAPAAARTAYWRAQPRTVSESSEPLEGRRRRGRGDLFHFCALP